MDRAEAIRATKNGAIAACISAGATFLMVAVSIGSNLEGDAGYWNDPVVFLDVALIAACAYGVHRKSRVASVLLFVHFVVSKVVIVVEAKITGGQAFGGIGIALVFLYYYGKAIQGSFVFHRLERKENPDYKAAPKVAYILGIPVLLILVLVFGLGFMTVVGVLPSAEVLSTDRIFEKDLEALRNNGVISAEDRVKYFYSSGFISILEGGNVLTQDRVILYVTNEHDDLQIYELYLDEITEVTLELQGDFLNYNEYILKTNNPERWIKIEFPVGSGGKEFVGEIRKGISR